LASERGRLAELSQGEAAVRAAFDGSYHDLDEFDRTVFRRIGSFPARTLDLPVAAALTDRPAEMVSPAMERLVDAHLVESPAVDRYRLHDLMRLYAGERLVVEESPAARVAALRRLAALLTARYTDGSVPVTEPDSLVPIVRAVVAAGLAEPAWELVSAAHPRLDYAGHHPLWLLLWEQAAGVARSLGDERRLSRALRLVATAHRHAGRVQHALGPAAEAAALARRLSDREEQVKALHTYGETLRDLNRLAEARQILEDALARADELGDHPTEQRIRTSLATVHSQGWQPELAVPVLEQALSIAPPTDTRETAWVLLGLAGAYRLTGREEEGVALAHRAVRMARGIGDDFALGYALAELMTLAARDGRTGEARAHLNESTEVFRRISHGTGVGIVHQRYGALADDAGRHREAVRHLDTAIAQFERLADTSRAAIARLYRAVALAGAGQRGAARAELAAAERESALPSSPEVGHLRARLRQRLG
jgi:tetratricopeptide (TPR) repeat protein